MPGLQKNVSNSFVLRNKNDLISNQFGTDNEDNDIPKNQTNVFFDKEEIKNMMLDMERAQTIGIQTYESKGSKKRKYCQLTEKSNLKGEDKIVSKKEQRNQLMRYGDCDALVWPAESTERNQSTKHLLFSICCKQGRVKLPKIREPPLVLEKLLRDPSFRIDIRVFNSYLSMCSMGTEIDYSILNSPGPFCFKVHGENYHSIESLLPNDDQKPKFLQMYIFDTANELNNSLSIMDREGKKESDGKILSILINMLDENNILAKNFRKARDRYESGDNIEMKIHLIGYDKRKRQYELPSANEIAGLIIGDFSTAIGERDVILQHKSSGYFQRILATHPLYMVLQYPLLFPYDEVGFYEGILYVQSSCSNEKRGFV